MKVPAADWWRRFFTRSGFPLDGITNDKDTAQEIRELDRLLPVPRGSKILDVACGSGRHAVPLARLGYEVTGVDASKDYLSEAGRRARRAKAPVRFLRRDMRSLGFDGEFDAAVNLWTSFGYFTRQADDLRALRSIRRALKPGGWLVIDLVNAARFREGVFPRHWARSGSWWVLEESRLREGKDPAMLAERIYIGPGGKVRRAQTFVRLYDGRRLKRLLSTAGFSPVRLTSGLLSEGEPLSRSRRLLALARRPMGER